MTKTLKRSFSLVLMLMLSLAIALPAFASTYNHSYTFYYDGSYHSHSSDYIAGPAVIDDEEGTVTFTLEGNYFPEVIVDGDSYYGTYSSGVTTFVIPGDDSADIPLELHVLVTILGIPVHNTWYELDLTWD